MVYPHSPLLPLFFSPLFLSPLFLFPLFLLLFFFFSSSSWSSPSTTFMVFPNFTLLPSPITLLLYLLSSSLFSPPLPLLPAPSPYSFSPLSPTPLPSPLSSPTFIPSPLFFCPPPIYLLPLLIVIPLSILPCRFLLLLLLLSLLSSLFPSTSSFTYPHLHFLSTFSSFFSFIPPPVI